MRCQICDSTYRVGKSGLCHKCRHEIARANYGKSGNQATEEDEIKRDNLNWIDTYKADKFQSEAAQ